MNKDKITDLKHRIKTQKSTFAVYLVLRILLILSIVMASLQGNYETIFMSSLALILFFIPAFVEKNFGVELPSVLEILIIMFIFAAIFLGEIQCYYIKVPFWDSLLHITNGFLCSAIGFALVDIINRNPKFKFELSPLFLAVVAFCFSMTIGVLWEFFEFACDIFLHTDMQKDVILHTINSVMLNENGLNSPVRIDNITEVLVNGRNLNLGGYLDIGLFDTMKDLFVNFIGAVVFSIIGYVYVKSRGKNKFAENFIPKVKTDKK